MSAILTIVGWYAAGFVIADRLVVHGHSPVVWWTLAALLGAAVVIPAVLAVTRRGVMPPYVERLRSGAPMPGVHLAALGPAAELPATLEAVPAEVAGQVGRVSLIGTVGHEAFIEGIDTGERSEAAEAIVRARPLASDDDHLLTSDGARELAGALRTVGVPDLVVCSVDGRPLGARRQVRTGIRTSCACGVPIMLVPPAAHEPARHAPAAAVTA